MPGALPPSRFQWAELPYAQCVNNNALPGALPPPLQARALVNLVATTQPRVADKVRDLQERSRGLLQRCLKQLTEKW
jgi:hypothetical protein